MSEPARFLSAFAQALSTMALYGEGHPAREKAIDNAFEQRAKDFLDELVWMSRVFKWGRANLPSKFH